MTDDNLREAAARALGWTPAGLGQWYAPVAEPKAVVLRNQAPPLDWITAGALLDLCAARRAYVEIRTEPRHVWYQSGAITEVMPDISASDVIEACVMALGCNRETGS